MAVIPAARKLKQEHPKFKATKVTEYPAQAKLCIKTMYILCIYMQTGSTIHQSWLHPGSALAFCLFGQVHLGNTLSLHRTDP